MQNTDTPSKDTFENNVFSLEQWSAPTMMYPYDIKNTIDEFKLVGRKIVKISILGKSLSLTKAGIEEQAYKALADLPEEERKLKSQYDSIAVDLLLPRSSVIDAPVLIEFEDGDVLEVFAPCEPDFRFSMNLIPRETAAAVQPNADAGVLFSNCVGKTVVNTMVNTFTTDQHPRTNQFFDDGTFKMFVSRILICLENNVAIKIAPQGDSCTVSCINVKNKLEHITFGELKAGLHN